MIDQSFCSPTHSRCLKYLLLTAIQHLYAVKCLISGWEKEGTVTMASSTASSSSFHAASVINVNVGSNCDTSLTPSAGSMVLVEMQHIGISLSSSSDASLFSSGYLDRKSSQASPSVCLGPIDKRQSSLGKEPYLG